MTFVGNLGYGLGTAFTVLAIISVGNVLTTYVSPSKQNLQEIIGGRIQTTATSAAGSVL